MAELATLPDTVAKCGRDGDSVALAGRAHLIVFAGGHEIVRRARGGPEAPWKTVAR